MDEILNSNGIDEKTYLETYDISAFDRPSLTVDMLLLTVDELQSANIRKLPEKSLKILLIKRNEHPFIGKWALPGGFVRMNENLDEAAYRELCEETGVEDVYLEQLQTFSDVNRDPRGRIISTAYMSLVDMNQVKTQAGSDASDAKWFDIDYRIIEEANENKNGIYREREIVEILFRAGDIELSTRVEVIKKVSGKHVSYKRKHIYSHNLSFDHGLIIHTGLSNLISRVKDSDIVFQLMPEKFTLTELQKTYEVILGEKLLKANFRRKVSVYVEETGEYVHDKGYRPSKLFRYKPYNL